MIDLLAYFIVNFFKRGWAHFLSQSINDFKQVLLFNTNFIQQYSFAYTQLMISSIAMYH